MEGSTVSDATKFGSDDYSLNEYGGKKCNPNEEKRLLQVLFVFIPSIPKMLGSSIRWVFFVVPDRHFAGSEKLKVFVNYASFERDLCIMYSFLGVLAGSIEG